MEGLLNGFLNDKIDLDLVKNQKTQRPPPQYKTNFKLFKRIKKMTCLDQFLYFSNFWGGHLGVSKLSWAILTVCKFEFHENN